MIKLIAFIVVTILFFSSICIDGMNDDWLGVLYMSLLYILFILVSLYELGRTQIEKEENGEKSIKQCYAICRG